MAKKARLKVVEPDDLPENLGEQCPECYGEGTVEVSNCKNRGPWQECCGGCFKRVLCGACDGEGVVRENWPIHEATYYQFEDNRPED